MNNSSTTYSRETYIVVAALTLVTAAVFAQSMGFGFFAVDDSQYVVRNPATKQGVTFENLATVFSEVQASNYHPITMLSLMLDTSLFGYDAGAYHRTNVLIHIANSILLLWLLNTMTGSVWRSAAVAFLFAIHPLHVEPVVWISSRKDLLSTFFMFIAVAFYIRFVLNRSWRAYAMLCVAFVLALLSKQMPVTLPFVLLLFDYWPLNRFPDYRPTIQTLRRPVVEKLPLFALAILFSLIIVYAQRTTGALRSIEDISIAARLNNTSMAYAIYLAQTLVPIRLQAIGYSIPHDTALWQSLGSLAILAAITAACLRYARKAPFLPVGWFFFLGTLVPVIGIVTLGSTYRADRYTYVPLIGLFIIAAWGVGRLLEHPAIKERRPVLLTGVALILAAYTVSAWLYAGTWSDNKSVLTSVVELDPPNLPAHLSLGDIHLAEGDRRKAAERYLDAVRYNPGSYHGHLRLGNMQADLGNHAQAERFYENGYKMQPGKVDIIVPLVRTKAALNKFDEAERILLNAIASGHPESNVLQAELDRIRNRNQ